MSLLLGSVQKGNNSITKHGIQRLIPMMRLLEVIRNIQLWSPSVIAYGIANLNHLLSRDGNFMPDGIYADFSTNRGRISVLLDYKKAPMTVANFIGLSEGTITNATYPAGKTFYSGSIWHRVVKGHVIQGGEPSVIKDPANSEVKSTGYEIPNEISDLSHNKPECLGWQIQVRIQTPASFI